MIEIKLTKQNFENEVLKSDIPVLVDFWAPWCGPCRMIGPIIEEIAAEADGKYKVGKINVDDEQELAAAYRIMSIPTIIVFKDGKPKNTALGVGSKSELLNMLK